jgi:prophage antirepressor-like protein
MLMNTFKFGESDVFTMVDKNDNIWFKGFDVASILGYAKPRNAILTHVDIEDKQNYGVMVGRPDLGHHENNENKQAMINESGMYSLILRSKLESAKAFKRWITSDVLPTIRKTGKYKVEVVNKPIRQMLSFKIENEFDLHTKVINFIKNYYPTMLTTVCNPELSNDTSDKRIKCAMLGYVKGTFDLIINNLHKNFSGYAIEFKSPSGNGMISEAQQIMKTTYENNNFKTLISNNYDQIITSIIEYMRDTRVKCMHCQCKFKSMKTLSKHISGFHRIIL